MTVQVIVGVFLLLLTIGLVYGIWKDEDKDLVVVKTNDVLTDKQDNVLKHYLQNVLLESLIPYAKLISERDPNSELDEFILLQVESELMFRNIKSPNQEISQYFDDRYL